MSKALRKEIMHRSKLKNIINTELKTTGQITKSKETFEYIFFARLRLSTFKN